MTTVKEAISLAQKGNTRAAEDAMMSALGEPDADIDRWVPVLEQIVRAAEDEAAAPLAWATLDTIQQRCEPKQAIRQSRPILRWFSRNNEFRQRAVDLYQLAFDDVSTLENLIEVAGLRGGKPIRRAMQTLDICLAIEPGSFLTHKDEPRAARVVSVDPDSWSVRIETNKGEELFDPVSLGDHYELAHADDYRVLQQFDPQGFKDKLDKDPAGIVLTIVRAHGNEMTSDELEGMLAGTHVPRSGWTKWWSKARMALKKNPHVRLEGRNPVIVTYEQRKIDIEDEIWEQFDIRQSPRHWLELARGYVRECKSRATAHKAEFLRRLRDAVVVEARDLESKKNPHALSAWLAAGELGRLAGEEPEESDAIRMLRVSSGREVFEELDGDAFWGMAFSCLQAACPDTWPQQFADLLPVTAPSRCDELVSEIKKAGRTELLTDIPQIILTHPMEHLNGLCWLYDGPKELPGMEPVPLITLLSRILSVLDQIRDSQMITGDQAREMRNRIRSILTARKIERFKQCIEQEDEGMGDALRSRIQRVDGLSEHNKTDLLSCIRRRFPDLWVKPRVKPWEDQSTLYCTEAGYETKDAELAELVNVKMKENAIAIGKAAEHGDLSENSEYKFALEERDLLRSRAATIQDQLARARMLHSEEVPTDHVSIGSSVTLREKDGQETLTISFLGPWEADPRNNILNYQAPISQMLMGKKHGETVELDFADKKGTFEVVEIDCALIGPRVKAAEAAR